MNREILKITENFHYTYERLSKKYGYETRKETRVFDINSNNGKLMYATVKEVISPILEENKELKKQVEEKENIACNWKDSCLENTGKIEILETRQNEFIKWLEDKIKMYDKDIEKMSKNYGVYFLLLNEFKSGRKECIEVLQKYKEIIGDDK